MKKKTVLVEIYKKKLLSRHNSKHQEKSAPEKGKAKGIKGHKKKKQESSK